MATPTSHRYRSATEYQFSEEQADAIIKTTAYHRKDFSLSVIWFPSREHVDIRSSIATPFPRAPSVGMGFLERLPLEILHEILFYLDLYSLFKFRQIDLRLRQAVDSLGQYQLVVSHGLNVFCALLRTRLAIDISLMDFYNVLCTKDCDFCGVFGGFVTLLTWKRHCFRCLCVDLEVDLQTLAVVREQFCLTGVELDRLRSFKTLPGIYSMNESVCKSRTTVVSVHQALLGCKWNICNRDVLEARLAGEKPPPLFNFMGSCALPYYDKIAGKVEHGISCAGCQLAFEKGILEKRCWYWATVARDEIWVPYDFLEHFRWCEQAQLLWRSSGEGQCQPPELPEVSRRGGYLDSRE